MAARPPSASCSRPSRQLERGCAGKPARPDLLEAVKRGEMSSYAATVEAGYTARRLSIPPTPKPAWRLLKPIRPAKIF